MERRPFVAARVVATTLFLASCTSGAIGGPHPKNTLDSAGSNSGRANPAQTIVSSASASPDSEIPSSLRRPLRLPTVAPGGDCPTSSGRTYSNSQFAGIALGVGPVLPLIGVAQNRDAGPARQGILRVRPYADYPGDWLGVKTLWFSFPTYEGPIFLRGRQLDGTNPLAMGEPPTIDPELPAGPTVNGENGFREWPGGTWVKAAGCYAWQVDGLDFSYVIVFKAVVVT
jgi:hypothetical protein